MKISIITVCLNSEKTILANLNSILSQTYKNIEHIIVDGGSSDKTFEYISKYPNSKKKIIVEKKRGIYNAMNIGIKNATGNFIGILNSDDILNADNTIENLVKLFKKNKNYKIFLGNVVFFKKEYKKIHRYYPSTDFNSELLKKGIMPPHPGAFIHKKVYQKIGLYNNQFNIAGDFDFFVKCFLIEKLKFKKTNIITTRMQSGGISGKNIFSNIYSSFEILKSLKNNKIKTSIYNILLRFPLKFEQFFFFKKEKLNKNFKFKICDFYYSEFKKFNIIRDIKNLKQNQNFVLSALNLAFLGFLSKGEIILYKSLINWPDGTFSKTLRYNLKKVPGRDIIRNLKIKKKYIKKIFVIGNLSKFSENYLYSKFNLPIMKIKLPYGSVDILKKKLNKVVLTNQDLVLITLPTPKQEQLARHLSLINKNYKIICIGASISIASGEEKEVPEFLKNFEFIWRLRYEPGRRLIRLVTSFYYFIYGILIKKKLLNVQIKIQK